MFIKICGVTREEDALLATALGADAVGFNFAPASPRQIAVLRARDIARQLPADVLTVGVFRDAGKEKVMEIVNRVNLRAVQLHGRETPAECQWIAERVPITIRAFPAGSPELSRFDDYGSDILLLDSPTPGSGEVFDWSLAEGAPSNRLILLAGGLTPENVGIAIQKVNPWGVDVATGVESEAGRKDPRKLRAFIEVARAAEPKEYESSEERPFNWEEEL
jgi:phosphoribosylanthranilate isomerase